MKVHVYKMGEKLLSKLELPGASVMLTLGLVRHDCLEHAALLLLQLLCVGLAV